MSSNEQINLSEKAGGENLKDALSVVTTSTSSAGCGPHRAAAHCHREPAVRRERGAQGRRQAQHPQHADRPLQKGWMSEQEAIERTGWQTIGVRSFVTKLRGSGYPWRPKSATACRTTGSPGSARPRRALPARRHSSPPACGSRSTVFLALHESRAATGSARRLSTSEHMLIRPAGSKNTRRVRSSSLKVMT